LICFISGAPLFVIMAGASVLGAIDLVDTSHAFHGNFDNMTLSMYGVGTGDQSTVLATIPDVHLRRLPARREQDRRSPGPVRQRGARLGRRAGSRSSRSWCCALFTVFTGASGVTIVALGGLLSRRWSSRANPQKFSLA